MEKNTYIEELYVKLFSGTASEDEITLIRQYVESSEENRINFRELQNIWELTHPAFNPDEIELKKAYDTIAVKMKLNKTKRKKISGFWKVAAAVIIIPLLTFSIYTYYNGKYYNKTAYQHITSPDGSCIKITLPDNSKVYLNEESTITFPSKFKGNRRNVTLIGEAFFDVTKNSKKPFVVHTSKMDIQVLGTKFNVNAYSDLSEIKTTLQEGKVKVMLSSSAHENNKNNIFLNPNEELSLNTETGDFYKKNVDASHIEDWFDGVMIFKSTLLSDALKRISKKYHVQIELRSQEITHRRLTVSFEKDESLENILEAIKSIIPDLKIEKNNDRYLIYAK